MAVKWKPFKVPLLTRRPLSPDPEDDAVNFNESVEPPSKKRRVDSPPPTQTVKPDGSSKPSTLGVKASSSSSQNRKISSQPSKTHSLAQHFHQTYYNILWRKPSTKKNKTWDGDGILVVRAGYAEMYGLNGKEIGRRPFDGPLLTGSTLSMAGREIEVESSMTAEQYTNWKESTRSIGRPTMKELDEQLRTDIKFNSGPTTAPLSQPGKVKVKKDGAPSKSVPTKDVPKPSAIPSMSQFKSPLLEQHVVPQGTRETPTPRHDPTAAHAIVMRRPDMAPLGKQIVDVVVDPLIGNRLREHQKHGVKFMYECVMGMKGLSGEGAILGDEMGLGKTLQVIALLWTLMKQNPTWGESPIVKKALVVCPVTTIDNWRREFRKWLGYERLGVFAYDDKDKRLRDFTRGRSYNVMIIGYERLRGVAEELQKANCIDIVIMDEVHRLKTAKDKSAQAIKALSTQKRIGLSGTILQNNLSELFFVVDLINPGLLGKQSAFRRQFEIPIERGRETAASVQERETANEREKELLDLTASFSLRRRTDILSKYLPPKMEYVIFCRPTAVQVKVYRQVLASPLFGSVLGSSDASLQLISILKKLCNSPVLLKDKEQNSDHDAPGNEILSSLLSEISPKLLSSPGASGKLRVLDSLLHHIRSTTDDKVVIVSNYTQTLDILSNLLDSLSYKHLRLDGSTPSGRRQTIIDSFNRSSPQDNFAFLLSAKSGGVGINLTGANRLILFDVDWNPATDLQAMARIHREGQKRPCHIYRLLTRGALDEKIYQRQLAKISLSDAVVDGKVSMTGFTREELRRLFALDDASNCQTHELLGCGCAGRGLPDEDDVCKALKATEVSEDGGAVSPSGFGNSPGTDFVSATQITAPTDTSIHTIRKGRSKMLSLMSYGHIDTAIFSGEQKLEAEELQALVADDALMNVLTDPDNRVTYVFSKSFGGSAEDA